MVRQLAFPGVFVLLAFSAAATVSPIAAPVAEPISGVKSASNTGSTELPPFLEENRGQFTAPVRFAARLGERAAMLTDQGPALSLPRTGGQSVVRMEMVGGKPSTPRGELALEGRVNYLLGRDRSKWRRNVRTFQGARYSRVYQGVDLVVHPEPDGLQYDFHVAPEADANQVRVKFHGLSGAPKVSGRGELVLPTLAGDIVHRRPFVYQDTPKGRVQIACAFQVAGETVSFGLGKYDPHRELVIDPTILTAAYVQTAGGVHISMARDDTGNVYFAGQAVAQQDSTKLIPTTAGVYQENYQGGRTDCFVGSLNQDRTQLRYLTYLGSADDESAEGDIRYGPFVAVTPLGEAWVAGSTLSEDWPLSKDNYQGIKPGVWFDGGHNKFVNYDVFLTALKPDGSNIGYSSYFGGTGEPPKEINSDDFPSGIAVRVERVGTKDHTHVVVAGTTGSTRLSTLNGSFQSEDRSCVRNNKDEVLSNATDAFLFHLDNGQMQAVTYLGAAPVVTENPSTQIRSAFASVDTRATGIAWGPNGRVMICGTTESDGLLGENQPGEGIPWLPMGSNSWYKQPRGKLDGFAYLFEADLADFIYGTFIGGEENDAALAIGRDISGRWAVGGRTESFDFPISEPVPGYGGNTDGFVVAFNDLDQVLFSTYLGGFDFDSVDALAIQKDKPIVVAGSTGSTNFPSVDPLPNTTTMGSGGNGFLARLQNDGHVAQATFLAGAGSNGRALGSVLPTAVLQNAADSVVVGGFANENTFKAGRSSAYRVAGRESFSTRLFALWIGSGPPLAPSKLVAKALSHDTIQLDWQDNSLDETEFHVERRPTGATQFKEIMTRATNQPSAIITGLARESSYDFRVRAFNGQFSEYSNVASAKTLGPGKIKVSPKSIRFPTVRVGKTAQRTVKIKNLGDGDLHVTVDVIGDPFFPAAGEYTISRGQVLPVIITFRPEKAGRYRNTLEIEHDDPNQDTQVVKLKGAARGG